MSSIRIAVKRWNRSCNVTFENTEDFDGIVATIRGLNGIIIEVRYVNHPILASLTVLLVFVGSINCVCASVISNPVVQVQAQRQHDCCHKQPQQSSPQKTDHCRHCDQALTVAPPDSANTIVASPLV